MNVGKGFRYALERKDPVDGTWKNRASGDDRALIMKLFRDTQGYSTGWRVLDRSTDQVLAGEGAT